ncbi:hypothetical protein SDC9_101159 [bioreactor metagenome]|uniref:Uncharacterized protein n=1 Tax=bioreactor metagenome TaxID=1076179 RepID=A0A645APX9_9ZZZZ
MKQQPWAVLIALLVILQVYSIVKINALERQLENVNYTVSSVENHLISQINDISNHVEQKLQEQASLILRASAQVGIPDADTLTVPVTFTVTPKTVTDTMSVSLDIDGELIPLERSGLEYSTTRAIGLSQKITPTIVIEEGGKKQVVENGALMLSNLKEMIFPDVYATFAGQYSYGSKAYKQKGQLEIDCKPSQQNNNLIEAKYIVKVDGKPVKETPVELGPEPGPNDIFGGGRYGISIDDQYTLEDGQVLTGCVVAVDSLGFTHEYQVLHYVAGSDEQREPDFRQETITAPNGEIIYRYDEESMGFFQ